MSHTSYLLTNQRSVAAPPAAVARGSGPRGQLFSKIDGGSGGRALDAACGAMGGLRILSEWVGPSGQIVGTDVDVSSRR